jgi:hypothetical protein
VATDPKSPGPPYDIDDLLRRSLGGVRAPETLRARIALALDAEDRRRAPRAGGMLLRRLRHPALVAALAASLLLVVALPWARTRLLGGSLAAFKASRHIHLVGLVICLDCARAGVPLEGQIHCREASHHNALLLPDRAIWRLLARGASAEILQPRLRGQQVSVEGDFAPGSESLEVARFARL